MNDDEDTWRLPKRAGSHWNDDRRANDGAGFRSRPPRVAQQAADNYDVDDTTLPHDLFDEPRPDERSKRDSDGPVTSIILRRAIRHVLDRQHRSDQRRHDELRELLDRAPRDIADEIRERLTSLEASRDAVMRRVGRALQAALGSVAVLVGGIYAYGRRAERFDALEQTVRELRVDIRELTRRSATDRRSTEQLAAGEK